MKPTKKKPAKVQRSPRVMLGISLDLHTRLKQLAARNGRPVTWELRFVLEKVLQEAGL